MDGGQTRDDRAGAQANKGVLGVGLGRDDGRLLEAICHEQAVALHRADDVRDLMGLLVNVACGGIVMGDQTNSASARVFEVNLATLKRLRAHPRGRTIPVLYLVHWPAREHVLQLAQLGVRDVVGQPACAEYIEERIAEFIAGSGEGVAPEKSA